jgi:hypothetical protein
MLSQTLAATQAAQSTESTVAQSDAVIKAAHLAKHSLTAAIVATQGNTALPNPDVIPQNHKSWTETAKQMGVTKSKCPCPAKDSRLIAQTIGIVKGKCRHIYNDPYTGGEQLGKRVKPDASSTANTAPPTIKSTPVVSVQAHTTVPPPTSVPRIASLGVAIPVQGDAFAPPPTCAPGIVPTGVAIPVQGDTFAPPPTHAPRIAPPGPPFTMLLQALTFYTPAPLSKFTTST